MRLNCVRNPDEGESVVHPFFHGQFSAPFASLADMVLNSWSCLEEIEMLEVEDEFKNVNLEDFRIINYFWQSKTHRKLHLEMATSTTGLQVVHCVMYPWPCYPLPMYAVDMVGFRGRISLAIADLCPTTQNLTLPPSIRDKLKDLTASLPESLPRRQAPDWGVPIFSAECCLVGPETEEDIGAFLRFATRALEILRQEAEVAKKANPKEETESSGAHS